MYLCGVLALADAAGTVWETNLITIVSVLSQFLLLTSKIMSQPAHMRGQLLIGKTLILGHDIGHLSEL